MGVKVKARHKSFMFISTLFLSLLYTFDIRELKCVKKKLKRMKVNTNEDDVIKLELSFLEIDPFYDKFFSEMTLKAFNL